MQKLYSRVCDHETVLELWGGSTKHPDSVFNYSKFQKSELCDENHPIQIFQWIVSCSGQMSFPFHAIKLVNYATNMIKEYFLMSDGDLQAWDVFCRM